MRRTGKTPSGSIGATAFPDIDQHIITCLYLTITAHLVPPLWEERTMRTSSSWRACGTSQSQVCVARVLRTRKRTLPSTRWKYPTVVEKCPSSLECQMTAGSIVKGFRCVTVGSPCCKSAPIGNNLDNQSARLDSFIPRRCTLAWGVQQYVGEPLSPDSLNRRLCPLCGPGGPSLLNHREIPPFICRTSLSRVYAFSQQYSATLSGQVVRTPVFYEPCQQVLDHTRPLYAKSPWSRPRSSPYRVATGPQ
jgi:hypothetical protein